MSYIQSSQQGRFLRLVINRPEKKNALTFAMYRAITAGLLEAEKNPEIRGTVISGHSGIFTAGNDLADFANPTELDAVIGFLHTISSVEKPLIAAVSGNAVGVGTTMLLHCDLVYAAADARFKMPFVDLGLVPEAASSLILPGMLGHRHASALLLLGETLNAEEAREAGIVNRVYPDFESLNLAVEEKIAILASKAPSAVRASKALMKRSMKQPILEAMTAEVEVFGQRLMSPETAEALQAFMQKRAPDFSRFS